MQTSHADLAPHVSANTLSGLDPGMLQMLGGTGEMAMAMINLEVTRQAAMIAYLNDYWLMTIVTAISVPLVVLLRKPKAQIKNDPGAAGH